MSYNPKIKIWSLEYRKMIFDLYKDTLVCVAIAILGVFLVKNDQQIIGWITYIVAGFLSILASVSTIKHVGKEFKLKEISKFGLATLLFFSLFSIIILIGGLLKGVHDII